MDTFCKVKDNDRIELISVRIFEIEIRPRKQMKKRKSVCKQVRFLL